MWQELPPHFHIKGCATWQDCAQEGLPCGSTGPCHVAVCLATGYCHAATGCCHRVLPHCYAVLPHREGHLHAGRGCCHGVLPRWEGYCLQVVTATYCHARKGTATLGGLLPRGTARGTATLGGVAATGYCHGVLPRWEGLLPRWEGLLPRGTATEYCHAGRGYCHAGRGCCHGVLPRSTATLGGVTATGYCHGVLPRSEGYCHAGRGCCHGVLPRRPATLGGVTATGYRHTRTPTLLGPRWSCRGSLPHKRTAEYCQTYCCHTTPPTSHTNLPHQPGPSACHKPPTFGEVWFHFSARTHEHILIKK